MKTERRNACHIFVILWHCFWMFLASSSFCSGGGASFRDDNDRFWASIRCWKGCLFCTFRISVLL